MKNKGMMLGALLTLASSTQAANAPIQRVDVVNLLGTGALISSVVVSFSNGVSTPCVTKTLPYLGAITVWAGTGQTCVTPISTITVTPVTGTAGALYEAIPIMTSISTTMYSSQLTISQSTSPMFDPSNGSLLISGTAQATVVSNLSK